MALIYCDGFDSYPAAASPSVTGRFFKVGTQNTTLIQAGTGRWGGNSLSLQNAASFGGDGCQYVAKAASSSIQLGFWIFVYAVNTGAILTAPPINLNGGPGSNTGRGIAINASGNLILVNTTLLGTSVTSFANGWHWVEMQLTNSASKVYIDYNLEINTSSSVLPTAGFQNFSIGQYNAGGGATALFRIDDLIIWDSSGSDFTAFPIGPQRIQQLNPSGAGDKTQWTASAGSNFSVAAQAYSGAQKLTTTVDGTTDLYQFDDMAFVPQKINAVVANLYCNDDGSGSKIAVDQKLSTVETATAAVFLPVGLSNLQIPLYSDANAQPFTDVSVGASQFGFAANLV